MSILVEQYLCFLQVITELKRENTTTPFWKVNSVPDGVVAQQERFDGCSRCGKIYWKGSHWDRTLEHIIQSIEHT